MAHSVMKQFISGCLLLFMIFKIFNLPLNLTRLFKSNNPELMLLLKFVVFGILSELTLTVTFNLSVALAWALPVGIFISPTAAEPHQTLPVVFSNLNSPKLEFSILTWVTIVKLKKDGADEFPIFPYLRFLTVIDPISTSGVLGRKTTVAKIKKTAPRITKVPVAWPASLLSY
ncbi:hypothetical protein CCACVL1_13533 [Corchorus capsularis]|uniref:Uncharacterized protein n=1 Tax=Corchorus capsularis TaxID=210143 RepID=A0A1R3IAM2_COCAP|nr:hypothetical protein CCACVL1_13533 [Corchorus capsularis]